MFSQLLPEDGDPGGLGADVILAVEIHVRKEDSDNVTIQCHNVEGAAQWDPIQKKLIVAALSVDVLEEREGG